MRTHILISRGDEIVGQVQVTTVTDDLCAGRIVDSKKPIKPGDEAMIVKLAPVPAAPPAEPVGLRTRVTDYQVGSGVVGLGAGRTSGVEKGMVFLIHRGDEFIGTVRVTSVDDTRSTARVVDSKDFLKPGDEAEGPHRGGPHRGQVPNNE